MMEREYQLVEQAERGIVIQAIFAMVLLIVYISVGLSGGISSGGGSDNDDFTYDDVLLEQVIPVPQEREISVWI